MPSMQIDNCFRSRPDRFALIIPENLGHGHAASANDKTFRIRGMNIVIQALIAVPVRNIAERDPTDTGKRQLDIPVSRPGTLDPDPA
jgi:hypothetical protein